jgi:hypothetical protein
LGIFGAGGDAEIVAAAAAYADAGEADAVVGAEDAAGGGRGQQESTAVEFHYERHIITKRVMRQR